MCVPASATAPLTTAQIENCEALFTFAPESLLQANPASEPGEDDQSQQQQSSTVNGSAAVQQRRRLPQHGDGRLEHLAWRAGFVGDYLHKSLKEVESALLHENELFEEPLERQFVQGFAAGTRARRAQAQNSKAAPVPPVVNTGVLSFEAVEQLVRAQSAKHDVVAGIIAPESLNIVAGDSGLGKSPFFYQMGISVAAGLPFLGRQTSQGTVVYLDFENGLGASNKLAKRLAGSLGLQSVPKGFRLWPLGYSGECNLEAIIAQERPKLCIIDSLGVFAPDAVAKGKPAANLANRLRALARKYGTAFLLIHHLKKPQGPVKPPELEDVPVLEWLLQATGPRGLVNHTDCRIGISVPKRVSVSGDGRKEIALVVKLFTRIDGETGPIYVGRIYDDNGSPVRYESVVAVELLANADQQKTYLSLPAEFTFADAMRMYGRHDPATAAFLKKCESLGLLKKVGRGRWRKTAASDGGVHSEEQPVKCRTEV